MVFFSLDSRNTAKTVFVLISLLPNPWPGHLSLCFRESNGLLELIDL